MKSTEDSRIQEFAELLVERGAEVEKGDSVYLLAKSLESLPLFREVRRKVIERGGFPHEHLLYDSQIGSEGMDRDWMELASDEQLRSASRAKRKEMEEMDCYIRIGGGDNTEELSGVDSERISTWKETTRELKDVRFEKKWVATRFPTDSMAQRAGMSTQAFESFLFDAVVGVDWNSIEEKNTKIKRRFDGAEEVRVVGSGTDIRFSLEGREGQNSAGFRNLPDGEVFYAPVKESVEGRIKFTYPGVLEGKRAEGIELRFEDGRVVEFSAEKNEEFLEAMLNTDENARYVGEFGIGTNRNIQRWVGEAIFDEKIGGSIHLALGNAYERSMPEGESGNSSGIHWDIVKDLRPEKGGGRIEVEGETVQEDGEWLFEV